MCRDLIPNADMMIYSSLIKEAIASSTIEGTVASPDELMLYDIGQAHREHQVTEVANYRQALEEGCKMLRTKPLTLQFILELHSTLLSGVRGHKYRGKWKTVQNYIAPSSTAPIEEANFTPVPPEETVAHLNALESYINAPQKEPKVIQAALVHYQFETIHPFRDGNGRVGRLMIVLHLIQLGLLNESLIYPSVYFERTRDQYIQALQDVRFKGDWDTWCKYFLTAIIAQCDMTIKFVDTCRNLQTQIRSRIPSVRRQASVDRVLDCFLKDLVWTIPKIREETKLSFNAIKSAVELLTELELVHQISAAQRRNRAFYSRPIFDAVFQREM